MTIRQKFPRAWCALDALQQSNLNEVWFPSGTGADNATLRTFRLVLRSSQTFASILRLLDSYYESRFSLSRKSLVRQGYVRADRSDEYKSFIHHLIREDLLKRVSHNTYWFDDDDISIRSYSSNQFDGFSVVDKQRHPPSSDSMMVRGDWQSWLSRQVWGRTTEGLVVDTSPWLSFAKPHPGFEDTIVLNPEPDDETVLAAARAAAVLARGGHRRLLLLGPPGTGKSRYAYDLCRRLCGPRVLVASASAKFDSFSISVLTPDAVILEDVDRNLDQTAMLSYLENLRGRVLVVLTANVTTKIDPALVRSGRVDDVVEVKVPSGTWLRDIIRHYEEVEGYTLPPEVADGLGGLTPAAIREVIQSIRDVGVEHAEHEVARVRRHAEYYTENRTVEFLGRR